MNEKKKTICTNIKTSRNEDISFLQLSYGNFVSLDDYMFLKKENQKLKGSLQTYEILLKANVEENEELKKQLEQCKAVADTNEELAEHYKNKIDKAIKHVSSLSSKGRDCMIYADVKKDILDILKEVE